MDDEQNIVDLEPGSEWRFELEADENVAVRVSRCDGSWAGQCGSKAVAFVAFSMSVSTSRQR